MSTCGSSLRHIFESTITENSSSSSLIDSLSSSLKQIKPIKPHLDHSFTEIFGELHFKENPDPIYSSHSPWKPSSDNGCDDKWWNCNDNGTDDCKKNRYQTSYHKRSDSFSSLNSGSLQLCTEGLGSESLDYVEDLKIQFPGNSNNSDNNKNKNDNYHKNDYSCFKNSSSYKMGERVNYRRNSCDQYRKRTGGNIFPPPISCIGETGKPGVCFQSYREDGRFVLKEIKIPTYERLHASREDGRLRLCLFQPSDQDDEYGDDKGEGEGEGEIVDNEDHGDKNDGREKGGKEEAEVRDDIEKGHF